MGRRRRGPTRQRTWPFFPAYIGRRFDLAEVKLYCNGPAPLSQLPCRRNGRVLRTCEQPCVVMCGLWAHAVRPRRRQHPGLARLPHVFSFTGFHKFNDFTLEDVDTLKV
jgi:hypothetical protein